jgi:hypothetical protein
MSNQTPILVDENDSVAIASYKDALASDRNTLRQARDGDSASRRRAKFTRKTALVQRRATRLLQELSGGGTDTTREILEAIASSGVMDAISEGDGGPHTRILRSHGLSLVGLPEIVIHFNTDEGETAQSIYQDLKVDAMEDKEVGLEKLRPGRQVFAARFMRSYSTIDGGSSPGWDVLAVMLPDFKSVEIVLHQRHAGLVNNGGGMDCAACGSMLPERHKTCPCHGAAYCGKECQRAHWKHHKFVCTYAPPPRPVGGAVLTPA